MIIRSACIFLLFGLLAGCAGHSRQSASQVSALKTGSTDIQPAVLSVWNNLDDPVLAELLQVALVNSPSLEASLARVERALALSRQSGSDLLPAVDAQAGYLRERTSANTAESGRRSTRNRFSGGLGLAWELDPWGRLRRLDRAAAFETDAALRRHAFSRLLLETSVAGVYLRLRTVDRELHLVNSTVEARQEVLNLVQLRLESGIGDELEVSRTRTEWATAAADLEALRRERANLEKELAVLVGEFPGSFSLPPLVDWDFPPFDRPLLLPSDLLRQRPDLAEAENLVAAAGELVSARQAERFPAIELGANVGYASRELSTWLDPASLFADVSPRLRMPLLNWGRVSGRIEQAQAEYRELVALYRQQVLEAFRGVENVLSDHKLLEREIALQREASESAGRTARFSRERYRSGLVGLIDVVDAERQALETARRLTNLQGRQAQTAVAFFRETGGSQ